MNQKQIQAKNAKEVRLTLTTNYDDIIGKSDCGGLYVFTTNLTFHCNPKRNQGYLFKVGRARGLKNRFYQYHLSYIEGIHTCAIMRTEEFIKAEKLLFKFLANYEGITRVNLVSPIRTRIKEQGEWWSSSWEIMQQAIYDFWEENRELFPLKFARQDMRQSPYRGFVLFDLKNDKYRCLPIR